MKDICEYICEAKWDASIETLTKDGWKPIVKSRGAGQKRYVWWKPSYYQLWEKDGEHVIVKTNGTAYHLAGDSNDDPMDWDNAALTTTYNNIVSQPKNAPIEAPTKIPKTMRIDTIKYDFKKSDEMWWGFQGNDVFMLRYAKGNDRYGAWNYYYTLYINKDGKFEFKHYKERYIMGKGGEHEDIQIWTWDTKDEANKGIYEISVGKCSYKLKYVSSLNKNPELKRLEGKYVSAMDLIEIMYNMFDMRRKEQQEWDRLSDKEKAQRTIAKITAPDARWMTDADYDDYPWYYCACDKFAAWFNPNREEFEKTNNSKLPDAAYEIVRKDPKVIKTALDYRRK